MDNKIIEIINEVKDESLKLLLASIMDRYGVDFTKSAASRSVHHSFEGGLLQHSYNTTNLAIGVVDNYPLLNINRDIVVCGAFVHDIGKISCYENFGSHFKGTDENRLLHHIPIGFHIVSKIYDEIRFEDRPSVEQINSILHIIVSHHGRVEYSSPRAPTTDEARIVANADFIDAYLNSSPKAKECLDK